MLTLISPSCPCWDYLTALHGISAPQTRSGIRRAPFRARAVGNVGLAGFNIPKLTLLNFDGVLSAPTHAFYCVLRKPLTVV